MYSQPLIYVAAIVVARLILAPSLWWCVINEIGRTRLIKCNVLCIAFIPHVFAVFWLAEAASFYGGGVGHVITAPCFCWAHAVKLPTTVATQKWAGDIRRRCSRRPIRLVVAGLLSAGYVYLVLYALTWRGCIGLFLWAKGLRKR